MWNANNSYAIFPFVSLRTYSENDCTTVVPPESCLSPTKDLVYGKTAKQCLEEISGTVGWELPHVHMHTYTQSDIRERHKPDIYTHTHTEKLKHRHRFSLQAASSMLLSQQEKVRYDRWTKAGLIWEARLQNVLFICACVYFSVCGTVMWQLIAEDRCLGLRRCSHTSLNNQSASNCKK